MKSAINKYKLEITLFVLYSFLFFMGFIILN